MFTADIEWLIAKNEELKQALDDMRRLVPVHVLNEYDCEREVAA